ncbi:unnamed protein product [Dovyalis caffra]|uniref:Dihydrolipoamide acetyltransferase component of pyruvate dehydrogenase complex n=1 Tax=Dovyalis caffra TaxID=77055 RepID=A0AAV1RCG9_9ROSI|nr:unnamed protein product [Dovyalis caffra]
MMIVRRIWHKRASSSTPRFLYPYTKTTPQSPPLSPLTAHKISFTGYASNSINIDYSDKVGCCLFSSQALADVGTSSGIVDVPLAQTGEGIAECELLKWFVEEGDEVEEFQPLCEVQSDKATIEITSRYKGKVAQFLYVPGDIVKVGETLLKMVVEGAQVPMQKHDVTENISSHCSEGEAKKSKTGGVLSTPAVRYLGKQYDINLNDVHGTGKDGRLLKEDILKHAIQKGIIKDSSGLDNADSGDQFLRGEEYQYVPAELGSQHDDKTVPLRGFQRTMVKTMSMAAKVPHFHYVEEINCDALVELKESFQNDNTEPGVKHTFLPSLIKSLSVAMSKYPWINSCFNEDSMEVILKGSHNIGIAMATPSGLVVPNIKNVQSLSILEITKELSRLQQLALANKLNPEDITGGTITLSNIGAIGGKFGAPILNLPEVAIIAIGRIQKVAHFADDGNAYPISVMMVNIGADHRVLDGATVAKFCNEWKQLIEKPELLMLLMR